jgi:5-methylcytosine-specific restriction protein A
MTHIKLLPRRRDSVPTNKKREYQEIYQDKRWKFIRAAKLREKPICERCEQKNRVTTADQVHHKIPFAWGRSPEEIDRLAFDYDNMMSVCNSCHDEIHVELEQNNKRKSIG